MRRQVPAARGANASAKAERRKWRNQCDKETNWLFFATRMRSEIHVARSARKREIVNPVARKRVFDISRAAQNARWRKNRFFAYPANSPAI
jgi:hypothetical protein